MNIRNIWNAMLVEIDLKRNTQLKSNLCRRNRAQRKINACRTYVHMFNKTNCAGFYFIYNHINGTKSLSFTVCDKPVFVNRRAVWQIEFLMSRDTRDGHLFDDRLPPASRQEDSP